MRLPAILVMRAVCVAAGAFAFVSEDDGDVAGLSDFDASAKRAEGFLGERGCGLDPCEVRLHLSIFAFTPCRCWISAWAARRRRRLHGVRFRVRWTDAGSRLGFASRGRSFELESSCC